MVEARSAPAAAAGTVRIGADVEVNRLGFGAMRVTGPGIWGPPADHDAAIRVIRRAVELGVDFLDTADSYGPEVSERLLAEALSPYPAGLVVATKGGLLRDGPGRWRPDGRPEHLRAALEGSLSRLEVEQVALYQFHRPDPAVPLEDSVGALVALRDEGKIAHIGLSNVTVAELERAQALTPIASVQNRYNPDDRSSEALVDAAERHGIAFIPWAPVGGRPPGRGTALAAVGQRHGASPAQVALAWLLARSPQMLPIPGTSSVAHLEENVAAAALALDGDDLARLGR
ncbi:MAG TPA: aldo/keto reductase [Acidimicrobiales bacterium]|nr:aldo/keto reductase [Acidimicrobiales bacterium]